MKKLTQAVFDDAPDWVKSAAVDASGDAWWYSQEVNKLRVAHPKLKVGMWVFADKRNGFRKVERVGAGYDTINWRESAINRGE